jgi:hypothetical protein
MPKKKVFAARNLKDYEVSHSKKQERKKKKIRVFNLKQFFTRDTEVSVDAANVSLCLSCSLRHR